MGDSAVRPVASEALSSEGVPAAAPAPISVATGDLANRVTSESRAARRPLSRNEIAYLLARAALGASWAVVFITGEVRMVGPFELRIVAVAAILSTVTSIGVLIGSVWLRVSPRTVLLAAAVPDAVGMVLAIMGSQAVGDPALVWVIGFAIVNSLLLPRDEARILAVGSGVLYLMAWYGWTLGEPGPFPWPTQLVKAAGVAVLGYFTASAVHEHAEREHELEIRGRAIERLNEELECRVSDLNAIAEITEVIHSSLDFEVVGEEALRIIEKAIRIPECSVHVVDTTTGATVVSVGDGQPPVSLSLSVWLDDAREWDDTDRIAYLTLMANDRLTVVLGAPGAAIARMQDADRVLLHAVATEISVAAENSRLYELTRQLSLTDELTTLHNYRYLQQRLNDEIERSARHGHDLSLLMIDVDDFKRFNDDFGHVAGDRALADIGGLLRGCVRDVDVPCRFGGEEFSVLLTETDLRGAAIVAEKVRGAIEAHRFTNDAEERVVPITVSIGVSSYPVNASDAESLLRTADHHLYQAKNGGRNRVCAPQ